MAKRTRRRKEVGAAAYAKATVAETAGQGTWSDLGPDWLWAAILFLAVCVTYAPVWRAGYIWDDDALITSNLVIVGPYGLKEIWTTIAADICPLTITTFWFEHALWGAAPLPYHLVTVFMHAGCAIMLWLVLRSLRIPGAWLGAAMWALHPLQVESVAWISEMKNTESCLFYLPAIFFFLRSIKSDQAGGIMTWRWNYGLTLLFAALAMASKSSTVILPVVLCLCAWWVEGRWNWRNIAKVAPVLAMAFVASAASLWTQGKSLAAGTDYQWERGWPERFAAAGQAIWFYLGKLVFPYPLMANYPRWTIDPADFISYLPLLAVFIALFIFWRYRGSWSRPWFFAFAYFLVALLPGLGLLNNTIFDFARVFDHFQYLAAMGPISLAGAGMSLVLDFFLPGKRVPQAASAAGVLLLLGVMSFQRAWIYGNEESLWTDTLAKNPRSWLAYNNLGHSSMAKGNIDEAIGRFQKSLEINPNYDIALTNLGLALMGKGQIDEAMVQLQKAVELNPNLPEARNNLGLTLLKKGKWEEGVAQIKDALTINPEYAGAHNNLGSAYFEKSMVDEAIAQFQLALHFNPEYADAHFNYAVVLNQKGQHEEAIEHFRKDLEINPSDAEAHFDLGLTLVGQGKPDEAIAQFQETLNLRPDYPQAQENLEKAQGLAREKASQK